MPTKMSNFYTILPERIPISTTDVQDQRLMLRFHLRRKECLADS